MSANPPSEVLRATRPPALVRLAAGAALAVLGVFIFDSLRERGESVWMIALWCLIWDQSLVSCSSPASAIS